MNSSPCHTVILYKPLNHPFGPKVPMGPHDNPTFRRCYLILWTAHPISHWEKKNKEKPTCLSKFHFGRAFSSTPPHELQWLPQIQRGRAETPQKSGSTAAAELQMCSCWVGLAAHTGEQRGRRWEGICFLLGVMKVENGYYGCKRQT